MELWDAVMNEDYTTLKELLKQESIDVNFVKDNRDVLGLACTTGNFEAVEKLIQRKDLNVNRLQGARGRRDSYSMDPLSLAVVSSRSHETCLPIVGMLLDDPRTDLNQKNENGMTPFLFAYSWGLEDIVCMFITSDRSIEIGTDEECSNKVCHLSLTRTSSGKSISSLVELYNTDRAAAKEKAKQILLENYS